MKTEKKRKGISYLLHLAGKDKIYIYVGSFISILSGICSFIPFVMVYQVMNAVFQDHIDIQQIINYGIIAGIAIILKFLFMILGLGSTHIGAFNVLYKVRANLMEHISKINLGFFNDNTVGAIKKTIIEDTERLENFLAHQVADLCTAITVPILMLIYMFRLHAILSLAILTPFVIGIIIQGLGLMKSSKTMKDYHEALAKMNSAIVQFITAMPEMKSFNMTTQSFQEYADAVKNYDRFWHKCTNDMGYFFTIFTVLINSGVLFVLPVGGILYLNGKITVTIFLFFLIMSLVFLSLLSNLINFMQSFVQITTGIDEIQSFMELEPLQTKGITLGENPIYDIKFNKVSFSYGEQEALKELDFTISQGNFVAFVGASGAGKTSAAQLIPKYWEVSKGSITISDININDLSNESLMDQISFVFQETFMLNDTVYENIAIGKKDCTQKEVEDAAKAAQIHDFIISLKDGYQTKLGDEGVKFSGGEKQRICIARAILKDAPIILFDEATSYTDIENEYKIQVALNNLLQDKTTIMIAHRLHTIINADKIFTFNNGRITEQGTHDELLKQQGQYAHMWDVYTKQMKGVN